MAIYLSCLLAFSPAGMATFQCLFFSGDFFFFVFRCLFTMALVLISSYELCEQCRHRLHCNEIISSVYIFTRYKKNIMERMRWILSAIARHKHGIHIIRIYRSGNCANCKLFSHSMKISVLRIRLHQWLTPHSNHILRVLRNCVSKARNLKGCACTQLCLIQALIKSKLLLWVRFTFLLLSTLHLLVFHSYIIPNIFRFSKIF